MAEETQASPQETSPVPEATLEAVSAASAPVSAPPGDRPVENLKGEFDRKFNKVQQSLDQVMQYLALQAQQQQAPKPAPTKELSKEELYTLATQGDRIAYEELNRRIAAEEYQKQHSQTSRQQTIRNQIAALQQKYPAFNDAANPLTQTFNQAYQLMLRGGYAQSEETLLDAMKTAIAERPDLVADMYSQSARAQEQQRRSATQVSAAGQTGAAHRNAPAPKATKPSADQIAQAQRMGVKDPENVMKRFYERQSKGQSSVSPMLKMVLESEEGA